MDGARDLGNSEMLCISFKIEVDKYQTVTSWLTELIWDSIFDMNRLEAITTRLLANTTEGPLWAAIRGAGLAHGTNFTDDIDIGYVKLNVYRSSNTYKAFEASRKIVENYVNGTALFDPLMVEGAINSIIVKFVNGQATITRVAKESCIRQAM